MVLTPTYHVYDMYKVHQDAKLLDFAMLSDDYVCDGETLKKVSCSISKDKEGAINATLVNVDPNEGAEVVCHIADFGKIGSVEGTVLTSDAMNTMNTFDNPNQLQPTGFTDFQVEGDKITIKMPPKSLVLISVKA